MSNISSIKRFQAEKQGNVAATFAAAILPIMLSVGAAIDYSRLSNLQSKVSHATDAALLAASAAALENVDLTDKTAVLTELSSVFGAFFNVNMNSATGYQLNGYTISYDPNTKDAWVDVDIDYKTTVVGIAGWDYWKADVRTATNMKLRPGGAFSMQLVLDRSGSMALCNSERRWKPGQCRDGTKMNALKTAVGQMVEELQELDSDSKYFRMGAVGYNNYTWRVLPPNWNLDFAKRYADAMWAAGGTDSSGGVEMAYRQLKRPVELTQHQMKSGQKPELVMVFMTDGNNNTRRADIATLKTCNKAKAYGMKIYTVAFQAPANGQALLRACASDPTYYFEPENSQELIEAFSKIGTSAGGKLLLTK